MAAQNFRERPEYADWRQSVFELFGSVCILCSHPRNIHAHHVRPVKTFPELAFDPHNGVPLCGNCHSDVNGNEMDYVEQFEQLQQASHGGDETAAVEDEAALRKRIEDDPTDSEAIGEWFAMCTDSQEVIEFYNAHSSTV